ncbi:9893_t:CDS:2 [Gigaspora margarita]|uniref:9893_t:CDS:1 n=1 Tax=Gigaspora margarita TaxID=4874 RepID=A0ABN7UJV7_GIGMA|nr:9893_t:CDS:2 [Gigaspora margarita]
MSDDGPFDLSSISDPSDFPQASLKLLDTLSRCSVCKDFFNTPMIAECGHVYCSLCIRRCLNMEQVCPVCRTNISEPQLFKSPDTENIVQAWVEIRQTLLQGAIEEERTKDIPSKKAETFTTKTISTNDVKRKHLHVPESTNNFTQSVVTGASDGIGREFAMQLAAAKFNVFLVSRTASKLEALKDEIETKYKVDTKMYAMDFAKGDPTDYGNLKGIIEELDVSVLVNNVATNHEIPTPFYLESDEVIQNIVEVNISGLLKAFMSQWSQAIGAELKSKGIIVENVNTYYVVTSMSKIRKPSLLIPLPGPYVKCVLSKIGIPGGAAYLPFNSNTYPSHALINWIMCNTFSWSYWVNYILGEQISIRQRALKKREREKEAAKSQ